MTDIPTPILLRIPQALSNRWQEIFRSLVEPIILIRRFREIGEPAEETLQRYRVDAAQAEKKLNETLNQIDGIAAETWKVGWNIKADIMPIFTLLRDIEVVERISSATHREYQLATIQRGLISKCAGFSEHSLLEELREAVVAEKEIDLQVTTPDAKGTVSRGGRPPIGSQKNDRKDMLKKNVYDRIKREKKTGIGPKAILDLVKKDKQFEEQVREAGLKLNTNLIRAALRQGQK